MNIVMNNKSCGESFVSMVRKAFSVNEFVEITVPTNVLKRANLMCMYIQEETESVFDIECLLELLYCDFVKYAIKNYNPSRVLKEATRKQRSYDKGDTLIVQIDGKDYKVLREDRPNYSEIEIRMPKREYQKGQLILDELEALYGCKISFEVMLSNLLINFIEDYKEGVNKRAYTTILKILKQVIND